MNGWKAASPYLKQILDFPNYKTACINFQRVNKIANPSLIGDKFFPKNQISLSGLDGMLFFYYNYVFIQ